MKNKEIQEQRMRGYFIQAAKEILKGEGLRSLNVRHIADKAGYSYATLYNYFEDVNELTFLCVSDFYEECRRHAIAEAETRTGGKDRLKSLITSYIQYFIQYPGTFDLFFIEKVGDFGNKENTIELIGSSLDNICKSEWEFCVNAGIFSSEEAAMKKSQVRYIATGMLLFYLNRRIPLDYKVFMEEANRQLENLIH